MACVTTHPNNVPANADELLISSTRIELLHIMYHPMGRVWTSPNARYLKTPPPSPTPQETASTLSCSQNPRKIFWVDRFRPFLAFWPSFPEWTGIFKPLDIGISRVPVVYNGYTSWSLCPDVIAAWNTLEKRLLALGRGLQNRNIRIVVAEDNMNLSRQPRECGYEYFFKTLAEVQRAALASRIAFLALSSFVSYMIALDLSVHPQVPGTAPSWLAYAAINLGLDPVWLNELSDSFVCDFTPGNRPGGYLQGYIYHPAAVKTLAAFTAGNVPLYIWWGANPSENKMDDNHPMWRYRPCDAEARLARELWDERHSGRLVTNLLVEDDVPMITPAVYNTSIVYQDSPESPPPHMQEDPYDMELWGRDAPVEELTSEVQENGHWKHLARLAEERREAMEHEGPDAARYREQHETMAEKVRGDMSLEEPNVGNIIYVWAPSGRSRHVIDRDDWKNTWRKYQPKERTYSADYEEWNLFSDRDVIPSDELAAEELAAAPVVSCEDSDDDFGFESEDEGRRKRKRKRKGKGNERHKVPLEEAQKQPSPSAIVTSGVVLNGIRAILRDKYMFMMPTPYVSDPRLREKVEGPTGEGKIVEGYGKGTKTILMRLGMWTANPSEEETRGMVDFYHYVVVPEKLQLFPTLWNLAPSLRPGIIDHAYFHYKRLREDVHVIGVRAKPLVEQWYLVVLFDPRAVVEVFHRGMSSVGDIVRYLIREGIPFATGRPVRHVPSDEVSSTSKGLGQFDRMTFNLGHYRGYEEKRRKLLLGSAGRAAMCRGGILWRLAYDTVKIKDVVTRPSSSALKSGRVVGKMDNRVLVDDGLSVEEEDIICGVYKMSTGKSYCRWWLVFRDSWLMSLIDFRLQREDVSWFPKASSWDISGLNHGYWTTDNEAWYQRRLKEIESGASPLPSGEWRKRLRDVRASLVVKLKRSMSDVCDRFLQGDISYWKE